MVGICGELDCSHQGPFGPLACRHAIACWPCIAPSRWSQLGLYTLVVNAHYFEHLCSSVLVNFHICGQVSMIGDALAAITARGVIVPC